MLANQLVIASCCIALMMMACGEDGGPKPVEQSSSGAAATAPDDEEQADDEEQGDPEPSAPEPDEIGLSCAVKELLAARCQGCHAADAKNGTPLLTRDDLLAEAKKDPTVKVIERVLVRVTAADKPMPPAGKGEPLTADEVATLRAWFEQGAPAGRCDGP